MFAIETYLYNNKIEYRTQGKNVGHGNINIQCVFCCEDRYHLSISLSKSVFTCWICSESGNYQKLISKIKGITYEEASDIVNASTELKQKLEERGKKLIAEKADTKVTVSLPFYTRPFNIDFPNTWQRFAYNFIKTKYDISFDECVRARLRYCYQGIYKNRIIIPVYKGGELFSFSGRTWDRNCDKRYLNLHGVNIKNTLYNIDNINRNQDILVVVEGVFGAIKVGLDKAVATFGTEVTIEQIKLLIDLHPKQLCVMFDNDENPDTNKSVGEKAQKLVDYLSAFTKTKLIKIPYIGKDPGDLNRTEIDSLL